MKLTIKVTQEDIDQGCKKDSENCAVARAATRALRELGWPRGWALVGRVDIQLDNGEPDDSLWQNFRRISPPEVNAWVMGFDNGLPVQPFEFELEIPDKFQRQPEASA